MVKRKPNYKFQLGQRVSTPLGDGVIDNMPYNKTTGVYGVWLDKPESICVLLTALRRQRQRKAA